MVFCLLWVAIIVHECKVDKSRDLMMPESSVILKDVRVTYYSPVPEQCSGNPLITANGSVIDTIALRKKEIRWCAVSRDVEELFPMGSEIEIFITEGHRWNNVYKIVDRTSARLTKTVDILSNTDKGGCYRGAIKLHKE